MTDPVQPSPQPRGGYFAPVVQRAKDMLFNPKESWSKIDGEAASVGSIYVPYVVTLAAIGPLAQFLGSQIFGYGALGFRFRPSLGDALTSALLSYVLTLAGVYVLALIINALAPRFGGQKNQTQALKVAAYAGTAGWIAAIFGLVPALAILGLAGLYSLYLLYLGLPRLMKAPEDKALGYTVVVILIAAVLFLIIGAVSAAMTGTAAGRGALTLPGIAASGETSGKITIPGGQSVDVKEAENIVGALGGLAKGLTGGATGEADMRPPVPAAQLKDLLPASIGGLARTSSENGQIAFGSMASAQYEKDDVRVTLSLTDLGVAGALTTSLAPETESERDGAYERVGRVNGRFTTEKYDRNARRGSFGVLIADRVMVQAEGHGVDMNQLKSAVATINARKLEKLLG